LKKSGIQALFRNAIAINDDAIIRLQDRRGMRDRDTNEKRQ
jgi:hypothetical protein